MYTAMCRHVFICAIVVLFLYGSVAAQTATGGAKYNRQDRERSSEQAQENWIKKNCQPPSCNREDPNLGIGQK